MKQLKLVINDMAKTSIGSIQHVHALLDIEDTNKDVSEQQRDTAQEEIQSFTLAVYLECLSNSAINGHIECYRGMPISKIANGLSLEFIDSMKKRLVESGRDKQFALVSSTRICREAFTYFDKAQVALGNNPDIDAIFMRFADDYQALVVGEGGDFQSDAAYTIRRAAIGYRIKLQNEYNKLQFI
jgi:hypothetical protein